METKMRQLFALAIACLTMATFSCTNDDPASEGGGDLGGDKGYISIVFKDINDRTAGLRANNLDNTEQELATDGEKEVNNVRFVLYFKDIVAHSWDFTKAELIGAANQTPARKITKKHYKALVMINPTATAKSLTVTGSTFAALEAEQDVTVQALVGNSEDNFMMSNWQGLVDIKETDFKDTEAEAEANPAVNTVYMERAVAKIRFEVETPVDVPVHASIDESSISWELDVLNKKSFFMRKQAQAIVAVGPGGSTLGEEDNDVTHRSRNYATDPNFLTGSEPSGKYNYFDYWNNANIWGGISVGDYRYVIENTMEAADQMRGVSTTLIVRLKYNPGKSSLITTAPGGPSTIDNNEPYFIFNQNWIFTGSELDALKEGLIQIDYDKITDADDKLLMQTFISNLPDYVDDLKLLSPAYTSFSGLVADNDASSMAITGNFSFIDKNHVNYYRIPVRHYEDALQPTKMAYGRFGVVRNNVYQLTLTEVKGPGRAVPGFIDGDTEEEDPDGPNRPDEVNDGYVSVKFQILQWVKRSHNLVAE